ncbi:MAG: hypothetical protein IJ355_01760 [Prevotella sp.]|nr:hypothetical protein [Prevotella sp.]
MRKATVSLDGIWAFLDSLSLSARDRRWLADKLVATGKPDDTAMAEDDEGEECMTKAEILNSLNTACQELKQYKEGKVTFKTLEEAIYEL